MQHCNLNWSTWGFTAYSVSRILLFLNVMGKIYIYIYNYQASINQIDQMNSCYFNLLSLFRIQKVLHWPQKQDRCPANQWHTRKGQWPTSWSTKQWLTKQTKAINIQQPSSHTFCNFWGYIQQRFYGYFQAIFLLVLQ